MCVSNICLAFDTLYRLAGTIAIIIMLTKDFEGSRRGPERQRRVQRAFAESNVIPNNMISFSGGCVHRRVS